MGHRTLKTSVWHHFIDKEKQYPEGQASHTSNKQHIDVSASALRTASDLFKSQKVAGIEGCPLITGSLGRNLSSFVIVTLSQNLKSQKEGP